jgi:hypothetical protein
VVLLAARLFERLERHLENDRPTTASVNTSNPGMLRFSSSSTKPRRRRPSMSAAFWFLNEPPPKSMMSKRCSGLVISSQSVADIFDAPLRFSSQLGLRASDVNDKLMEGYSPVMTAKIESFIAADPRMSAYAATRAQALFSAFFLLLGSIGSL